MADKTETPDREGSSEETVRTSGHVERAVLHHMAGDGGPSTPTTVSAVLPDVSAVIRRGDYANVGPRGADGLVRKSSVRRTFTQLREKGLVRRVADLDGEAVRDGHVDLGTLADGGDPGDPAAYSKTSDDARVTDWVLTDEGRREVERLDARYAAELDDLAARYGRPRGETTDRVDA